MLVVTRLARALLRRGGRHCGRRRRRVWHRPDFSVSQVFPRTDWPDGDWRALGGTQEGGIIGRELEEEEGMVLREVLTADR